jgi:transposase
VITKISKYRTGEPRFGTRGSADNWDNSVKVSYLSPEELAKYRNGEKGGSKVFVYEDFLKMEKEGMTKQAIADKMRISMPTLYNRIKAWKQKEFKQPQEHVTDEIKPIESKTTQEDKQAEFRQLINELSDSLNKERETNKALENQIQSLTEERDHYRSRMMAGTIEENLKKTIERYEEENKALRALVRIWI